MRLENQFEKSVREISSKIGQFSRKNQPKANPYFLTDFRHQIRPLGPILVAFCGHFEAILGPFLAFFLHRKCLVPPVLLRTIEEPNLRFFFLFFFFFAWRWPVV